MNVLLVVVLASLAYASEVDDDCSGRCCTLKITRPPGEEAARYSGIYVLKNGSYVMKGNDHIRMEQVETTYYDYGEEDYVDFENWGIVDDDNEKPWQKYAIEGGLVADSPIGIWPNGGEAKCLKKNKKGKCRKVEYTHARGENGIYVELKDTYGAQFGFRSWKQLNNTYWIFKFNKDHVEFNVQEGGFSKTEDQDYWDDYSYGKSGGTLEGEWTDGTTIDCIGEE